MEGERPVRIELESREETRELLDALSVRGLRPRTVDGRGGRPAVEVAPDPEREGAWNLELVAALEGWLEERGRESVVALSGGREYVVRAPRPLPPPAAPTVRRRPSLPPPLPPELERDPPLRAPAELGLEWEPLAPETRTVVLPPVVGDPEEAAPREPVTAQAVAASLAALVLVVATVVLLVAVASRLL